MSQVLEAGDKKVILVISGITCLDCAAKFEKNVAALQGITKAKLNPMTGKMIIEGSVDIDKISHLGREENYIVSIQGKIVAEDGQKTVNWEARRAIVSGLCLTLAYGVEKTGGVAAFFIALYTAAILIGGWGNFRKTVHALPRGNFNMSVLMSIAVFGAVAIGQYEEGAAVAFLYSISEMLEAWTMEKARSSIKQLMDIAPKTAIIQRNGVEQELAVEEIFIDDVMVIRPGEKIAMDGRIVKGQSAINQAAITGESIPAEKGPGDEVYAGTLNTDGSLEVKVTKLVQDTAIAKIIHMVEEAQSKRAPSQAFVENFAAVYTPAVIVIALGIVLIPPVFLGYEWAEWIYRGLALLVVACPCALVISTPVAVVSAISNAARNGVLIKGGVYLEEMGSIKAVAFDKTGTLTKGQPIVTDIVAAGTFNQEELLNMAARLEIRSEHPLAAAVLKAAMAKGIDVVPAEEFRIIPGCGAQGNIEGQTVYIGNARLFTDVGITTNNLSSDIEQFQAEGKTVMIVGTCTILYGIIAVADEVRATAPTMISDLKQDGIHTVMITGDNVATAAAVAESVGIYDFQAELLPEDKVNALQLLINKHGKVAMVGDGINDAPALALATVGIAMGGAGTDTALETADIALMADDLSKLSFTIRLSRRALEIIRQNITFAIVIKALAVAAVFPGWLTLWMAILADTGAAVIVTLNSVRLLKLQTGD